MKRYKELARAQNIWISLGGFQQSHSPIPPPSDSPSPAETLKNSHIIINNQGEIISEYSKIHLFDVKVDEKNTFLESSFTTPGTGIVTCPSPIGQLGKSIRVIRASK